MIIANVANSLFLFCFLCCAYFSQILGTVFFPLLVYYETAAVKICFIFYLNYLMDGFLTSIFSNRLFLGPVECIDPLISSRYLIFYSFVFPLLFLTHPCKGAVQKASSHAVWKREAFVPGLFLGSPCMSLTLPSNSPLDFFISAIMSYVPMVFSLLPDCSF